MKLFWTFICVALLVACQNGDTQNTEEKTVLKKNSDGTTNASGQTTELLPITELDGNYEVASAELEGKNINLRGENKVTLSFERGKMKGSSICNKFSGAFSLGEGNSLSITEFNKGKRICSGKIGKENNLLSILETAGTYEIMAKTAVKVNSEKGNLLLRKIL